MEENKVQDFNVNQDITLFFNNFIKSGEVIKERTVAPNFKVKLRVLNTGELLAAESVLLSTEGIASDIVAKVRAASILSQAVISINGIDIEKENLKKEENNMRRSSLYQQLLKTPAIIVQKAYALYIEAVKEQNEMYDDIGELTEKTKNF
jgi:hypothetical protein